MPDLTPAPASNSTTELSSPPEFSGSLFELASTTGIGFAIARDVITASGPDAATYLQGQLSQDAEGLAVGDSAWTLLLQPQGKLAALMLLTRTSATSFALQTDVGAGVDALARLQRFKLRVDCELELATMTGVAVRGAVDVPAASADVLVAHNVWAGIEGADILGSDVSLPAGITEIDADQAEVFRVATGLPQMGSELDEKTIPAEAGIVMMSASFTKGCYVGQELVARVNSRGNNTPRHLARLASEGPLVAGTDLQVGGETVGVLTSVVANPDGGWLALGYLARKAGEATEFEVTGSAAPVRLLAHV